MALAAISTSIRRLFDLVEREEKMPVLEPKNIFFAHAEEDFSFVKTTAGILEPMGYSCWYYERDAVPGRSYLAQIHEAIVNSKLVVLIVSNDSLGSVHVDREVDLAYEKQRVILPICRNTTPGQLESERPTWKLALGTTVMIPHCGFCQQIEKLKESLETINVRRSAPAEKQTDVSTNVRREKLVLGSTPPWAADGTQFDISSLKNLVFRTPIVEQFINSDQKLFVCGTKGLGKTLLLRFKRSLITERHSHDRTGGTRQSDVLFIPADRPYLDMMNNLPTLDKKLHDFLKQFNNCKKLWSFSIRFSVVSYVPAAAAELLKFVNETLPPVHVQWLTQSPVEPSVVFKHMLTLSVKNLNKVLDSTEGPLDHVVRNINRSVYVFIDKVDQGISELAKDQWCNVQGGLLEAAWDRAARMPMSRFLARFEMRRLQIISLRSRPTSAVRGQFGVHLDRSSRTD